MYRNLFERTKTHYLKTKCDEIIIVINNHSLWWRLATDVARCRQSTHCKSFFVKVICHLHIKIKECWEVMKLCMLFGVTVSMTFSPSLEAVLGTVEKKDESRSSFEIGAAMLIWQCYVSLLTLKRKGNSIHLPIKKNNFSSPLPFMTTTIFSTILIF